MTGYISDGQYDLVKLSITSSSGEVVDLSKIFVDFSIYESIYSEGITGNISLIDTFDLPARLPIYGNELIDIEFYTAGNENNPSVFQCRVFEVGEKSRITEHSFGYSMQFASEEIINNDRTKFRSAFKDTISNTVKRLFKVIKRSGSTPKQLIVEDSAGIYHYTGTGRTPIDTIQDLSSHAKSVKGNHGYVFYEDSGNFNFVTLQQLYQRNPVTEFIYRNAGIFKDVKQRSVERFTAIQQLEIVDNNILSRRVADGIHGSTWSYFDLRSKTIINQQYNKTKSFKNEKALGNHAHLDNKLDSERYQDRMVYGLCYGTHNKGNGTAHRTHNEMAKLETDAFQARILVNGDSTLKAGHTCNATIPLLSNNSIEETGVVNGKFLIADIKHTINKSCYVQTILLQKDSFEQQLVK